MAHKKKEKIIGLYTVIDKHTNKELARNLTLQAIEYLFPCYDSIFLHEDIIIQKQKGK